MQAEGSMMHTVLKLSEDGLFSKTAHFPTCKTP